MLKSTKQNIQNDTRAGILSFFGLCLIFFTVNCNNEQEEFFSGLPGGHEGPPATAGPPMDPDSWHKVPGTVLDTSQVWGNRVNATTTFKVPGGMGLLYSSHPGRDERQRDPEWVASQHEKGLTTGPSGSIAFTRDLFTWQDHPDNPVLNETQRSWQHPGRVLTSDLFYDVENSRWVAYFGDRSGDYPGIRAIGVTYSKDLVNWEYAPDGPLLTIEDYAALVPDRIEATDEELEEHGRVYLSWAIHYNGQYYVVFSGTETVAYMEEGEDAGTVRSASMGRVVMVGDTPEGPFEHAAHIDADNLLPGSKPVYWNGKWYSVFSGTWDDQPGFGLAWTDELFGPVTRNPQNPVITVETTQRSSPVLFNYDGTWGILFSRGANWWEPLPLRLAIANYHPSLIMPNQVYNELAESN